MRITPGGRFVYLGNELALVNQIALAIEKGIANIMRESEICHHRKLWHAFSSPLTYK